MTYFTKIFISNSLKTSKVVIDTDKIIHDEDRLFSSDKFICWAHSEPSLHLAANSPKGSFLERIYRLKNKNNCFFSSKSVDYETIVKFEANGFILSAYFFGVVLVTSMINFRKQAYWISNSFYELKLAYLYRRSLPIDKKRILNNM